MSKFLKNYIVAPGRDVKLSKINPADRQCFKKGKKSALAQIEKYRSEIESMQELLYAGHKHKVLIVLGKSISRSK